MTGDKMRSSFTWFVTSTFGSLIYPDGINVWKNNINGAISQHYSYSHGFTERCKLFGIHSRGFIKNMTKEFNSMRKSFRRPFIVKNSDTFIQNAFNLELPNEEILYCKMPFSLSVLSTSASSEIVAFINAGDIQGAVESLNCDKVTDSGLIEAVTKDLNNKLHNLNIEYNMKSQMTFSSQQTKNIILERIKEKIDKIKEKVDNITEKLSSANFCSICFDSEIVIPTITPCCNTKFCFECVTKWLSDYGNQQTNYNSQSTKGCPHCRAKIAPENLIVIDNKKIKSLEEDKDKNSDSTLKEMDKIETFSKLISDRKTHSLSKNEPLKILIFTEYSRTFEKFEPILQLNEIKYSVVSGTTNTVNKRIREYKSNVEESIDCLLLNAEYCASGLNLENTTDIITTHKMTSDKLTQIIGRGQRPGRKGKLNIWHLRYKTEV